MAKPDNDIHEGGCLCGAVRYRITGPIDRVGHCHCRMCQRANGAVAVTWATVPLAHFEVTQGAPATYRSSATARRQFCSACGSSLTFWFERNPEEIDVSVGTLDHPERHPADHHNWTTSKLPWLRLDEDLPAFADFTPGS
ncbi:MAG: GFA family protein [Kiloniellales bacterium]